MGTLVDILSALIIITAVILALLVLILVVRCINARKKTAALLKSARRDDLFVYRLLRIHFPKSHIFKRVMLPETLPDGTLRKAPADIILVDSAGVFVIRVRNFHGQIDNPRNGTWTVKNQNGTEEFFDPFCQNIGALRAVTEILKSEGIFNVPRHNMVVFTGRRLAFKYRYSDLLPAEHLVNTLNDYNRDRCLNQSEINRTIAAIRKYLPQRENNPIEQ